MPEQIVIDASVLVAALLQDDAVGEACASLLWSGEVVGPSHLPIEAASAIRSHEARSLIDSEAAGSAIRAVAALPFTSLSFERFAERAWELRRNATMYDSAYIAVAEITDLPLATLDLRLARAPGSRCRFVVPS